MRVTDLPLVALTALAIGCGSSAAPDGSSDLGPDAGESSRGATLPSNGTPSSLLEALSPAVLPPPPADVSNRHADDARAAALGQALFFDPSVSGPLLDLDNDGSTGTPPFRHRQPSRADLFPFI